MAEDRWTDVFESRHFHQLLHIKWEDNISNEDIHSNRQHQHWFNFGGFLGLDILLGWKT